MVTIAAVQGQLKTLKSAVNDLHCSLSAKSNDLCQQLQASINNILDPPDPVKLSTFICYDDHYKELLNNHHYCIMKSCCPAVDVLRETRIILPKTTNDKLKSLEPLRKQLELELIRMNINGFTRYEGFGGWVNNHEGNGNRNQVEKCAGGTTGSGKVLFEDPIWIYDIAVSNGDVGKLEQITKWLKLVAEQEAIYFRQVDGTVVLV